MLEVRSQPLTGRAHTKENTVSKSTAVAVAPDVPVKTKAEKVNPSPIELVDLKVRIQGDTPLMVHAWSEKAKRAMLEKQMKKAKQAKEAKVPLVDFVDSMYWLSGKPTFDEVIEASRLEDVEEQVAAVVKNGRFGFPAIALKSCIVSGAAQADGQKKSTARASFLIRSASTVTTVDPTELIEIIGVPTIDESLVRVGSLTKVADLRYRGVFKQWAMEFVVRFNRRVISAEQLVGLVNLGGFGCGLGEWRPQKNGQHGMFSVASISE